MMMMNIHNVIMTYNDDYNDANDANDDDDFDDDEYT